MHDGMGMLRPGRRPGSGPLRLGLVYAVLLALGAVGAVVWAVADARSHGFVHAASVAASAFATWAVLWLAAAALENLIAGLFRWPYLWVLPSQEPRRPDLWVALAVPVGILAGYIIWQ